MEITQGVVIGHESFEKSAERALLFVCLFSSMNMQTESLVRISLNASTVLKHCIWRNEREISQPHLHIHEVESFFRDPCDRHVVNVFWSWGRTQLDVAAKQNSPCSCGKVFEFW